MTDPISANPIPRVYAEHTYTIQSLSDTLNKMQKQLDGDIDEIQAGINTIKECLKKRDEQIAQIVITQLLNATPAPVCEKPLNRSAPFSHTFIQAITSVVEQIFKYLKNLGYPGGNIKYFYKIIFNT